MLNVQALPVAALARAWPAGEAKGKITRTSHLQVSKSPSLQVSWSHGLTVSKSPDPRTLTRRAAIEKAAFPIDTVKEVWDGEIEETETSVALHTTVFDYFIIEALKKNPFWKKLTAITPGHYYFSK